MEESERKSGSWYWKHNYRGFIHRGRGRRQASKTQCIWTDEWERRTYNGAVKFELKSFGLN